MDLTLFDEIARDFLNIRQGRITIDAKVEQAARHLRVALRERIRADQIYCFARLLRLREQARQKREVAAYEGHEGTPVEGRPDVKTRGADIANELQSAFAALEEHGMAAPDWVKSAELGRMIDAVDGVNLGGAGGRGKKGTTPEKWAEKIVEMCERPARKRSPHTRPSKPR